jgi:hypothetical protein
VTVDRHGVEEVELLAPLPLGADQVGGLQDGEVLAHRLAGHREPGAQLPQRLAVALVEPVEQPAPVGVGQRFEHLVHVVRSLSPP